MRKARQPVGELPLLCVGAVVIVFSPSGASPRHHHLTTAVLDRARQLSDRLRSVLSSLN
jgi:hypothetical protein